MKIVNDQLYRFLEINLSRADFKRLYFKMGISSVKWARLITGQDEWTATEVGFIAQHLGIHWFNDFCKPLQVGGRISLEESNRLSRDHGQVMEPVDVAA